MVQGGYFIMPKRGENIRKRKDGRWEARIIDFYKDNGKAHYKSIYGESYTAVKTLKKDFDLQKNKDINKKAIFQKSMTDICIEWFNKQKIKLKYSTQAEYYRTIHNHIIPYFKDIEPKNINNKTVQNFIGDKYNDGHGLSAKTICDKVTVLLQIIRYSEKEKYFSAFDYDDIDLPKIQTEEFKILTQEEEKKLDNYLKNNLTLENFGVILTKETGIRIGELCALKLDDLDLEKGTLNINKTIQRVKNLDKDATTKTKIIITAPKSKKSTRIIPLPDSIVVMAKNLYKNYGSDTYILTGTTKYIEPRILQKKFKQLMDDLEIKDITVHSLRHFFATKAVENGFDVKSLSEILGHASVRFTLEKYVRSSFELKRKHMNKMAINYNIDTEKMAS